MPDMWDDAVVAFAGHCPRAWLQCADVIVSEQPSIPVALRWAVATLLDYPGCTVAVAFPATEQWSVSVWRGIES